jgi:hypothetical protein
MLFRGFVGDDLAEGTGDSAGTDFDCIIKDGRYFDFMWKARGRRAEKCMVREPLELAKA